MAGYQPTYGIRGLNDLDESSDVADAFVFVAINGKSLKGADAPSTDEDPYRQDGGEA